jgi:uncharacterized membrane protein
MARLFLIKPGGYQDLVAISALGVLTVLLSIYFPGSLPLVFMAFFCVFFAPGWALASYLFPGPKPVAGGEEYSDMTLPLRVAASVVLSVLMFAIGGLLLAWSPLGLTETTVLLEALVLTLGLSALAMWRRASLAPGQGLSLSVEVPARGERLNRLERIILVIAVAGLLFAAAVAVDNLMKGGQEDPYTELFITGPDGKVSSLPQSLQAGADGIVQVHVNNQMGSAVDYVLTVGIPIEEGFANVTASDWSAQHALVPGDGYCYEFTVGDGQGMVEEFTFSIGSEGSQQVLFLLDFEQDTLDTWLWVTVT